MRDYKKLRVYSLARDLGLDIYKITESFPSKEMFGLTNQIRRAGVSVIANIAEGCGRESKKDFAHFINISIGSLFEAEALLEFAFELKYLNEGDELNMIKDQITILRKSLINLKKKIIENENQ